MPKVSLPILAGVLVDASPDVRIQYPVNMVPVPGQDSIADGYLRPAEGIVPFATGQGNDRGAIVWNDVHYRVSGAKFISINSAGTVTVIDDLPGTDMARLDYSFDRLGIAANGILYYWDGITLLPVTDPNIGVVEDMVWVDGYFMVTDGTFIVVTNLSDPTTVNPLKYATTDQPDPVKCLLKVLNQVHVVSRHFIDVFENTGGSGFPFQRIPTAVITKGAVGKRAACVFQDSVAFVGGGRSATGDEAPGVYLGKNAQTAKISSREIDQLLLGYTATELSGIFMETVVNRGSHFLHIALPDRVIVYDATASKVAEQPVWHTLTDGLEGYSQYRARSITRVNDVWVVGDPASSAIGLWSETVSSRWGVDVRWEFSIGMLRNDGKGFNISQLELVALTGTSPALPVGYEPRVSTSYSTDGRTWSQAKSVRAGKIGDRSRRLVWFQQGYARNWRIQRWQGDSSSRITALRVEADIEPLNY